MDMASPLLVLQNDHQCWDHYGNQLPDVQFGGPYTYKYTWWIQGDYPEGGFGLFCPRSVFDGLDDTRQYLTGSLIQLQKNLDFYCKVLHHRRDKFRHPDCQ